MKQYPLLPCPACGAGEEITQVVDEYGAEDLIKTGLTLRYIPPKEVHIHMPDGSSPGLIGFVQCTSCGYLGPWVWCRKGVQQ